MDASCDDYLVSLAERHLTYKEISGLINKSYGISLSPNAISKRLKRLGFPSRKGQTRHDVNNVKQAMELMLPGLPETVGYRCMTNKLRQNGIHVRRRTVMNLMRVIDPAGVEFRRRRRISRRVYLSDGPNHVWHVDGYDKLKPYGFAIHGCIDGYSRKIMWLSVGASNNDPAIIALNYVTCVREHGGCPMILQSDPGTENTIMGALQCVFRNDAHDSFHGINSYRVTRSVFNQRIEAWWSMLRRRQSQWWMTLFRDMERNGIYHRGNDLEKLCLRYCLMPYLQMELDLLADEWNCHLVSSSRCAVAPGGRPYVLYSFCEASGGKDCIQHVGEDDVEWAVTQCREPSRSGSTEFDERAKFIFEDNGWSDALTWQDSLQNYVMLLRLLS